MRKIILYILPVVIFYIFLIFGPSKNRVETIFFDVGQGDAFAFRTPGGKIIMVDGGPDWLLLPALSAWLSPDEKQIDILILSHNHSDHISSLPEIAERYKIRQAILPRMETGGEIDELVDNLNGQDSEIIYPAEDLCLNLETDCELCIFPPSNNFVEDEDKNNRSLALRFDCHGLSVAAAGDAGREREQELIMNNNWRSAVFKASHHGSDTSNDEDYIAAINPAIMVVSVGKNNSYGHPSTTLLKRVTAAGVDIWRTDQQGSLLIYSNNSGIIAESWP